MEQQFARQQDSEELSQYREENTLLRCDLNDLSQKVLELEKLLRAAQESKDIILGEYNSTKKELLDF